MGKYTTNIERNTIIQLWKANIPTNRISSQLKLNIRSVQRIIKNFKEKGKFEIKSKTGRRRKTTTKKDFIITGISKLNSRLGSNKISKIALKEFDIKLSPRSIRRRLNEYGGNYSKCRKIPFLSEKQKNDRILFSKQNLRTNWKKVIFSDETTIQLFRSFSYYWKFDEKEEFNYSMKYPPKQMFWGCFDSEGVSDLIEVNGNMNSKKYKEILEKELISFLDEKIGEIKDLFKTMLHVIDLKR